MPKFIDYHTKVPPPPPEMAQQMLRAVRAGQADPFGVKMLNQFAGTNGEAFCLTEAPSADAIRQSHRAAGVPAPDRVTEVHSLV